MTREKINKKSKEKKERRVKEKGLLKQTQMEIKQLWQQEEIDSYYQDKQR